LSFVVRSRSSVMESVARRPPRGRVRRSGCTDDRRSVFGRTFNGYTTSLAYAARFYSCDRSGFCGERGL